MQMPSGTSSIPQSPSNAPKKKARPWEGGRLRSFRASSIKDPSQESIILEPSRQPSAISLTPHKWWRIKLFRGIIKDIRRRAPYYMSDWVDAWDYRVIPALVYMYFTKYASMSAKRKKEVNQAIFFPTSSFTNSTESSLKLVMS